MRKKNIAIVYNQSLKQVQGINFVNSSFVEGQRFFNDRELDLFAIYSPDCEFICKDKQSLDLIGSNLGVPSHIIVRKLRVFLRKILPSEFLLGALIKIYFNHFLNAKKAVRRMLKSKDDIDYIIFQDVFTASYYQRIIKPECRKKTILILHCSNHELEQFKPLFRGVFKYKFIGEYIENYLHNALYNVDKVVYLSEHAMNVSPISPQYKAFVFNGKDDLNHVEVMDVSNPLNFVIVASTIYHKGHHILLEALSKLDIEVRKQIHLYIIGYGTEYSEFKKLSKILDLDDIVTFMGNRNDVSEQLKIMDIFILPSLSEGMPMSIIEAMRQGLFVMATPVGGIPEMLNETFAKFIKRDSVFIANSITEVVCEKLVTKEKKILSREHYLQNFTLQKMINSYSDILLSL